MLKLDDNLLQQIGLGTLPPDEKKSMLKHIYETLEMRVGVRLAEQMTDAQLDEFEKFVQAQDDNGAFHWLETNFPNYKDVVAEEFEKLKAEVSQVAPQIVSESGQPAPQAPQPQLEQQPQYQTPPQQPPLQ